MISKLARRFGFQQAVPVSLVENWHIPTAQRPAIELAPRGGAASCLVDPFGRLQIASASWSLEFTLAAGARWVAMSEAQRVTQKLIAPAVVETTVQTPSGPIVQRVAAGIVEGEPVAIIEIENTGGVAIAMAAVARPLRLDGRGHIGAISVDARAMTLDAHQVVRFETAPASVAVSDGPAGDLLKHLPDATDGTTAASTKCRSGAAQAAAVWPIPHTATVRLVVELGGTTSSRAIVPKANDINRGWEAHLAHGMRVDVDGLDVAEHLSAAARSVLTLWPEVADAPAAICAMSELGFGRDGGRFFERLERCDDDDAVLRALARWAQLGEQAQQLDELERILGRLAQAAHSIAGRGAELVGPPWIGDALVALGGRLHQIDQPDVADRVHGFTAVPRAIDHAPDKLAELTANLDKRGVWPGAQMQSSVHYVRALRAVVVDDTGAELRLLPDLPVSWRGRTIDVFGLAVANGTVSFGLRWHGPRPALFWEANLAPEAPVSIRVPGIDPTFVTSEHEGEALLADPGWPSS